MKRASLLAALICAAAPNLYADNWSGFYLGGSYGFSGTELNYNEYETLYTSSGQPALVRYEDFSSTFDGTSFSFGAGYDYELKNGVVVGAFVDYFHLGLKNDASADVSAGYVNSGAKFGYAINSKFLAKVSVGYAAWSVKQDQASEAYTGIGVGVGADYKIANNWIASLSYNQASGAKVDDFGSLGSFDQNISASSVNFGVRVLMK